MIIKKLLRGSCNALLFALDTPEKIRRANAKKKAREAKKAAIIARNSIFTNNCKGRLYNEPIPQQYAPTFDDILKSPHTLIAGTTGSGKSVVLNNIIMDFLTNYGVNNKLFLIDPKRVELSIYKKLPHVAAYTSDTTGIIDILNYIIKEMESRYKAMEATGSRNYSGPHYYVIIDELADIMISDVAPEFRRKLQKILQLGRAANIHIIAATQAPNRQIIPANIVLNFTNRMALRCLTNIESKQIINISGAELLPQYGRALYLSPGKNIESVNIPMATMEQIQVLLDYWTIGDGLVKTK